MRRCQPVCSLGAGERCSQGTRSDSATRPMKPSMWAQASQDDVRAAAAVPSGSSQAVAKRDSIHGMRASCRRACRGRPGCPASHSIRTLAKAIASANRRFSWAMNSENASGVDGLTRRPRSLSLLAFSGLRSAAVMAAFKALRTG